MKEVEVISDFQKRRKFSNEEKAQIVGETFHTGSSVAMVAKRHKIAPNVLYCWRRKFAPDCSGTKNRPKSVEKSFTEIVLPEQSCNRSMLVEIGDCMKLHIPTQMPLDEVVALLRALKGLS